MSQTRQVYVVHAHERSEGSSILKVFTTKEDAEEFAVRQSQDRQNLVTVTEAVHLAPVVAELLARLKTHADAPCLGWNNRFYVEGCGCGPCLDRAAIAKAEGRTP